jgi:TetR/AcrR family transcriptional regulator
VARLPQPLSNSPVGRTRLSREALNEHQRERILTTATEVFAKRGFTATTVDNIVAAANIGVGSFYAHFEGKGECLLAVCDRISHEVHAQLEATTPADGDWAERALAGLHAFLSFIVAKPLAARVMMLEAQTGGPETLARYGEGLEEVAAFLREGRSAAKLDPATPATFEEAAASGLAWLLQGRLVRGEADDLNSLFVEMAEVALEPYLGAQQTKAKIRAFTPPAASG